MKNRPNDRSMSDLAVTTEPILLRNINARLGQSVASRVEAEDILQQAYVSALPHFRRRPVLDPRGFVRWILRFATNEIRNTSRRFRGESASIESEDPASRAVARIAVAPRGALGCEQHERVFAMRDRFTLPWTTVSFLLRRPNRSSTRKLLGRARNRLNPSLSSLQGRGEDEFALP